MDRPNVPVWCGPLGLADRLSPAHVPLVLALTRSQPTTVELESRHGLPRGTDLALRLHGLSIDDLAQRGLLLVTPVLPAIAREARWLAAVLGPRIAALRSFRALGESHRKLHPDVILMDLSLPGMDGWQATRELKADRRTQRIPVIVITGHALGGVADSARAAGCDAFITKPCSPDDVLAEIRRLLAQTATDPPDRR